MSEHFDLRLLLDRWPYDPSDNVRIVRGADGRPILQVRLALGIEQYELEGRPDGQKPYGKETALDYHLERLAKAKSSGQAAAFELSPSDCAELFDEGTLFYYRYLHLFQAKDWRRTMRDTERNLRLFDFVRQHAQRPADQEHLEKWRPYLLRMNAAARAMLELTRADYSGSLRIVQAAIEQIESLPEREEEAFLLERQRSLEALRDLATQIEQNRPLSELERLERELQQAVAAQKFERAAVLRDLIRELRKRERQPG
jgi:hypothetical protein